QTASFGKLTLEIGRKHPMVSRQRNKLYAAAVGKRAGTDQDRINWLLRKARKGRIDLATTAGVEDFDSLPTESKPQPGPLRQSVPSRAIWHRRVRQRAQLPAAAHARAQAASCQVPLR